MHNVGYCNAAKAEPSHGRRQHAQKISSHVWFLRYACRQTDRHTRSTQYSASLRRGRVADIANASYIRNVTTVALLEGRQMGAVAPGQLQDQGQ